jgi:anti-sigma-K factor RskA
MNYESTELLDRVAGDYVLGTLRGSPRRRFERLCTTSDAARQAMHRWEDDFSVLSRTLTPVEPSAGVWLQISRRLSIGAGAVPHRPRRWRTWSLAAAASLIAVGLVVGLIMHARHAELQTIAVLGRDATQPLWRIERTQEATALTIEVVGSVQAAKDSAFELWALPRGGNPVSLGILPASGTTQRMLSAAQRAALLAADKIAVSVEPSGGSPTGSPTGPIIIVAPVPERG